MLTNSSDNRTVTVVSRVAVLTGVVEVITRINLMYLLWLLAILSTNRSSGNNGGSEYAGVKVQL